jgi:hypothetical protein
MSADSPVYTSEDTDLDIRRGPLYRAFQERWQAEALVSGRVWITTLNACRRMEDSLRRDGGEGTLLYRSGEISGPADDPRVHEVARRAGLGYAPGTVGGSVTVVGCLTVTEHADVYALCMSTERMTKFGPYCVRISEPLQFLNAVGDLLVETGRMLRVTATGPDTNCHFGVVRYLDRSYRHLDPSGHPAFVKPPIPFAEDKEVRAIFRPTRLPIAPFELPCPDAAAFCELLT